MEKCKNPLKTQRMFSTHELGITVDKQVVNKVHIFLTCFQPWIVLKTCAGITERIQ